MQPLIPQLPQTAVLPPSPLPAQAQASSATLLLASLPQVEAAPESFAGELAQEADAMVDEAVAPASAPVLHGPLPLVPAEQPVLPLDVEAVLHSLLSQRDVQVQAREGEAPEVEVAAEPPVALRGLFDGARQAPIGPRLPTLDAGRLAQPTAPAAVPMGEEPTARPVPTPLPVETAAAQIGAAVESDQAPALTVERPAAAPGALFAATPGQAVQPAAAAPALEQRLALHGPEAKWGEQMLNALRDSVEMQVRQGMQQATIRLDPPELGSLEIFLSHEGGRIQVQISAAQSDVARLLQQTSERLRQDLVSQHFVQVDVQVGAEGHSGQRQGQQARSAWRDDAPLAAREVEEQAPAAKTGKSADVLVTV